MEFYPNNYFGIRGFFACILNFTAQTNSNQEISVLEKIRKEAPARIACAIAAYEILPYFAVMGSACHILTCAYKLSVQVFLPLLRGTATNRDRPRFEEPLQRSCEHFIIAIYNLAAFFFNKSAACAFLFPYETLKLYRELDDEDLIALSRIPSEGRAPLISVNSDLVQDDLSPHDPNNFVVINPPSLTHQCARFFTGLLLRNLRPQDDLRIHAPERIRNRLSVCFLQAQEIARRLSGSLPVPNRTEPHSSS